MTYYVEPDYWVSGYAEGDSTGTLTFAAGATIAIGTMKVAGSYKTQSFVARTSGQGLVLAGPSVLQTFPGINLNAKSQMIGAGTYRTKGGGLIAAQSDTKAGGRIFWEITSPASGTWTEIVPQAEGTGE